MRARKASPVVQPIQPDIASLSHGGDLSTARRLFSGAPEPFIDLSTGINPHSYPVPQLSSDLFARLPEPAALDHLAAVAAAAYGAASRHHVLVAPGTQILLTAVAAQLAPARAAVLGPTYAEFARAAALAGHHVTEVADIARLADADLAIVANPNNPDGRVLSRAELLSVAEALRSRPFPPASAPSPRLRGEGRGEGPLPQAQTRGDAPSPGLSPQAGRGEGSADMRSPSRAGQGEDKAGRLLIIDEAFMDIGPPDASLGGDVARGNIVVLRSFGKFYGLAGVRLGFALAAPDLVARLAAWLGPWAVSAPALAIGAAALADAAWAQAMRAHIADEARRLDALLAAARLDVVGGTSLFRLVRTTMAGDVFDQLGRAGIWVRRFADQPTALRFGLPADEAAWERLRTALATRQ
jgi:cobalamin biosynthetic protein CobC